MAVDRSVGPVAITGEVFKQRPVGAYDFHRSTEDNYAVLRGDASDRTDSSQLTFAAERQILDYSYHAHYSCSRVALQDAIVQRALDAATSTSSRSKAEMSVSSGRCTLKRPWIIFSAGPMGAGKSHVVNWLRKRGLLPVDDLVRADPDLFRTFLPEWEDYKAVNAETAGRLTQKEAGLLVELTTEAAMARGLSVWQDGSLQDVDFFRTRIENVRRSYPGYCIAMMYVIASEETIRRRVRQRGDRSGRVVPQADLDQSLLRTPLAFEALAPQADLALLMDNDDEFVSPSLREVRRTGGSCAGCQTGGVEGIPQLMRSSELSPIVAEQINFKSMGYISDPKIIRMVS